MRSSENNFFLPRYNSRIGHKSLSYQGSKLRTKLLFVCLNNISHFGKFEDELKSYLLNSDLIVKVFSDHCYLSTNFNLRN